MKNIDLQKKLDLNKVYLVMAPNSCNYVVTFGYTSDQEKMLLLNNLRVISIPDDEIIFTSVKCGKQVGLNPNDTIKYDIKQTFKLKDVANCDVIFDDNRFPKTVHDALLELKNQDCASIQKLLQIERKFRACQLNRHAKENVFGL